MVAMVHWEATSTPPSPAEVTLTEKTLENIRVHDGRKGRPKTRPKRLIADKGYDSDPLRNTLKRRGITLLSPYRKNRKKKRKQDQYGFYGDHPKDAEQVNAVLET